MKTEAYSFNFNSLPAAPIKFGAKKYIEIPLRGAGEDTFARDKSTYDSFLAKTDKFTVADYQALSEEAKAIIKERADNGAIEAARINVNQGLILKEKLDKLYGKDGYMFVSIGTSPSLIGKVMEFSGVEVRYLPISRLASQERDDKKLNESDFSNYAKFLKSQGLSFKDRLKSPKKVLFYDYTKTGTSLNKFKEIIRRTTHIPSYKSEFRSLNDDLFACSCENEDEVIYYIDRYLHGSLAGQYSSINSLPFDKTDKIPLDSEHLTSHGKDNAKIYDFLVADTLNKYRRLKENPANDCAL